jgi:hypothetical protein
VWLLSPEYVAVIVFVPVATVVVTHVAVPDVTFVVPQFVFELQLTVPVTSCDFTPFLRVARPYCPLIVAVNVTDCPYVVGLPLETTEVLEVA